MTEDSSVKKQTPGEEFIWWAIKHIRLRDVYDQFEFPNDATNFDTMRQSIVNKINKIFAERLHPSPSGWIEIKPGCEMPATIEGKDYSANVLVILDGKIGVMAYCYIDCDEDSGWAWCNCYGDINGDPEFDSDYKPTHWQPLPPIPRDK
jgi:hypothetical protein